MQNSRSIIMNFQSPPSLEDMSTLAEACLETIPDELVEYCDDLEIVMEDFPSTEVETEMDLDDSFELLALYRNHSEKIPGVEDKNGQSQPVLILYRRPILDTWCETEDDLSGLMRHVIVYEVAQANGFSEAEAEALAAQHHPSQL